MLDFYNYEVMFTSEIMNDGYDVYMNKSDITSDPEEVKGHYYNNKIHWVNKNIDYKKFQEGSGVIALDLQQFYDFLFKWYHSSKAYTDPSYSIDIQKWYELYVNLMKTYYNGNQKHSPELWTYYDSITLHSLMDSYGHGYCHPDERKTFINFPKGRILEPEISWAFIDCFVKFMEGKKSLFVDRVEKHLQTNYQKTLYCALEKDECDSPMCLTYLLSGICTDSVSIPVILNKAFNNPIDIAKGKIVNTPFMVDFIRKYKKDRYDRQKSNIY